MSPLSYLTSNASDPIVKNMSKTTKTINIDQTYSDLRTWYYTEIGSIVDSAIEACQGRLLETPLDADIADLRGHDRESAIASWVPRREARVVTNDGEYQVQIRERELGQDSREFLTEWVDQATDDHEFVIYTLQCQLALVATNNDNAYTETFDDEPVSDMVRLVCAMRADVWEALEYRSDEWDISDEDEDDSDPDPSCGCDDDSWCMEHAPRETIDAVAPKTPSLIAIGDRVVAPAGPDTDRGRVIDMGVLECEVAWDSGITTWISIAGLVPEVDYVPTVTLAITSEPLREHADGECCFPVEIEIDGVKMHGQISLWPDTEGVLSPPSGASLDAWVSLSLQSAFNTLPDAMRRATIEALKNRESGSVTL